MHTTRTPPSRGLADLTLLEADSPRRLRRRPPRIVLVAACSSRKRVSPPTDLRLSSIAASPVRRAAEWRRRIREIDVPVQQAQHLYAGDHWRSVCEAHRLAKKYSSRSELWVISAGYGLIAGSKLIKPYSATFASGATDSVWRGRFDGDRRQRLRLWWAALQHDVTLGDLLAARDTSAVVIAAGADYLTVLAADLEAALQRDTSGERLSVISAGTLGIRRNEMFLPANSRFRQAVGGTDSSLNARLLALLARDADAHQFHRPTMAAALTQMAATLPSRSRRTGRSASDAEISERIDEIRQRVAGISRTNALHQLRLDGIACEQSRFEVIWNLDACAKKP